MSIPQLRGAANHLNYQDSPEQHERYQRASSRTGQIGMAKGARELVQSAQHGSPAVSRAHGGYTFGEVHSSIESGGAPPQGSIDPHRTIESMKQA